MKPIVSIIMGSTSDWPVMKKAANFFEEMEIPFEVNALSAHRTPDQVTIDMLNDEINNCKDSKGFIFDGFPRTIDQAKALDSLLSEKGEKISLILSLDVSEKELLKRLLLRGKDSGRVDDQSEEVILNRINIYKKQTLVLKDYYENSGYFFQINGEGKVDRITDDIFRVIDNYIE